MHPISIFGILAPLLIVSTTFSQIPYSYRELKSQGIISGFGVRNGDPSNMINRIPAIDDPKYVRAEKNLYPSSEKCFGVNLNGSWRFSPIAILNSHEIVNHNQSLALCYCPLAGLACALADNMHISGLLKWDTFVLFSKKGKELILPFAQQTLKSKKTIPLQGIQFLNFSGILKHFPQALILDPAIYRGNPQAYGDYPVNDRMGIGHSKEGLKTPFLPKEEGFHPKEMVLVAGFDKKLMKAYPFKELEKKVSSPGGYFSDTLNGQKIQVYFYPEYHWAYAMDKQSNLLNLAYSYIFALKQHLPQIEVYRAVP